MAVPKILLYYAFRPLADPEAIRLWQRTLCESLGLTGRIIVSPHGINGTVGGVKLTLQLKAAKRGAWEVKANGKPVSLTSAVAVSLRVGDDQGVRTVNLS